MARGTRKQNLRRKRLGAIVFNDLHGSKNPKDEKILILLLQKLKNDVARKYASLLALKWGPHKSTSLTLPTSGNVGQTFKL